MIAATQGTAKEAGWAVPTGVSMTDDLPCTDTHSEAAVREPPARIQALMSEEAEAPPGLADWQAPQGFSVYAAGGAAGADVPRTLVWQSFLKEGGKDTGGCS